MNALILCVGRLKEKWQIDGCAEYLKRLSRYGKYEIIAVDDVKDPEHPSEALIRQGMEREGAALMKHIRPNDRVVALCIRAQAPDSVGLANLTSRWMADGRRVVFVIGGSSGVSDTVRARADELRSFGSITLPHNLARVVLLEQLYRTQKILRGEPYHK